VLHCKEASKVNEKLESVESLLSLLSMESREQEGIGAHQIPKSVIDYASHLARLNEPSSPILLISKSEKEIEIISKNRDALLKREQYILKKAFDVDSSPTSLNECTTRQNNPNHF